MEEVKKEVLEALGKIKKIEDELDGRSDREMRDDLRADRGDALADRMDKICDKLTDKLNSITVTLTGVDLRLNNHLSHHEKMEDSLKKVLYPLIIAVILGAGALIWNIVRMHI